MWILLQAHIKQAHIKQINIGMASWNVSRGVVTQRSTTAKNRMEEKRKEQKTKNRSIMLPPTYRVHLLPSCLAASANASTLATTSSSMLAKRTCQCEPLNLKQFFSEEDKNTVIFLPSSVFVFVEYFRFQLSCIAEWNTKTVRPTIWQSAPSFK